MLFHYSAVRKQRSTRRSMRPFRDRVSVAGDAVRDDAVGAEARVRHCEKLKGRGAALRQRIHARLRHAMVCGPQGVETKLRKQPHAK